MAHTLSIYDGVEATTLALADTGTTGYTLQRYASAPPEIIQQRVSSIYVNGSRPVQSKSENAIEVITVEVQGSSRDDLFAKLRALYRAVDHARDYAENPGLRKPTYISYKPTGATNTGYAILMGGRVDVPTLDGEIQSGEGSEGDMLSNRITGVQITIEREPFWRGYAPVPSATITNWATSLYSGTKTGDFFSVAVSGMTGDVDGLARFSTKINSPAILNYGKMVLGYRSAKRGGSQHASAGLHEIEGFTLTTGTATPDTTASPGGAGNTKVRSSFPTVLSTTKTISIAPGAYRAFMRAKLTGAGSVTLGLDHNNAAGGGTGVTTTTTCTATSWTMHDMGIIRVPKDPSTTLILDTLLNTAQIKLTAYAIWVSGAIEVDLDCLFIIPCDEYYLSVSELGAGSGVYYFVHDTALTPFTANTLDLATDVVYVAPAVRGIILIPPGDGTLYVMLGTSAWVNDNAESHATALYGVPLYSAPRGAT